MIVAQPSKIESDIVSNNPEDPAFGGYIDVDVLRSELKKQNDLFPFVDQIREHAVEQNKRHEQKSARALIEIGDIHFGKGAFHRAAKAYIKALKLDDDNIPAFQKLIQSLVMSEEYATAERFYTNFLKKVNFHPRYINEYLAFRIMISVGNEELTDESVELIQKYKESENDAVLNNLGLFYALAKHDEIEAEYYFRKALDVNSNNVDANNNLGVLLRGKEKFDDAEKLLQKAHFLNLKYSSAYENLAGLYFMQNNTQKAISILENADENAVEVSDLWKHNLAMFYYQNGQYETSIAKYKALYDQEPKNSLLPNNIGAVYEKLRKLRTAERFFDDAIGIVRARARAGRQIDPRAVMAFLNKARVLLNRGHPEDALDDLKEAHKYFPREAAVYHIESVVYVSRNDYDRAKEKLRRSLSLNPQLLDSLVDLSYILEEIDFNFEDAIQLLESVDFSIDHLFVNTLANNLAYAYIKTNQLTKAKDFLWEKDTTFASYATKGFYHLKIDNLDMAEKFYRQSIEHAPEQVKDKVYQFYYFELMEYWHTKGDAKKALLYAKKSLKYNVNTRVHDEVVSFIDAATASK